MRTFTAVMAFTLLLSISAFARTGSQPIRSLQDLPSHWEGVAGNLMTKSTGELNISKILKVTRNDGSDGFAATYDVDASIRAGERELKIKSIALRAVAYGENSYEMVLNLDDELVFTILASIVYDEASDSFTLRDIPSNGERHFVFHAPAKK